MKCRIVKMAAVALSLACPLVVVSDDSVDVQAAIEMRQQGFSDMGAAFKSIRDQFRRPKPVMVMIKEYSRQLTRFANEPVMEKWFPEGSGPGQGIETEALPVIWERFEEFNASWDAYVESSSGLDAGVASGNLDEIRKRLVEMNKACESCHDNFREESE